MSTLARADVPVAQTWHKESVFADVAAWQEEFASVAAWLPSLAAFNGTLTSSPDRLADWLEAASQLRRRVMKLYFYAAMSAAVDSSDTVAKGLLGQVGGLYGQAAATTAFAEPQILAMGEAQLLAWIAEHPRLAIYEQWAKDLFRQQAHVLSAEVEAVLGALSDPLRSIEEIASELANADMKFADAHDSAGTPHAVTQSSLDTHLESHDRTLRRSAWQNYADAYLAVKHTLTQVYLTHVKTRVTLARLRKHDSVLAAQLSPFNLPQEVFHNLIRTFKANLGTWHRFWDVKRRILKQDMLQPYDIWAPMTQNEPKVSYEQAVEWISAGMQPLGDAYVEVLRRGTLEQRWVDYAPNSTKRQGAFSFGTYDTYPFIMMSYDGGLGALSTLAHELGHSLHSYWMRQTQPEVYAHYSMFVAEVASNFNQAMTRAYLFQHNQDRDFQLALIQEAISNFHRYFFIMPTLARFEYEVYSRAEQNKSITTDDLLALMRDLYAEGYGDTMTDDPERTAITWAQFLHLYEPYYTFQYATGISAAHALAEDILAGDEAAARRYMDFLKVGGALYPLDALKLAGVDMTTPEAVEKTYGVLARLVDRLESFVE